jgi:hypothetical protein
MSNKDLFKQVKDLNLPLGQYALFGSAPMGIRGMRECHDMDIIVTENLWNEFEKDNWDLKFSSFGNPYFCNGDIEMGKDFWKTGLWSTAELIREADIIDGLPFVKLATVLEWKKLMAREKDLKDIEIIEKFLQMQNGK